MVDAHCHLYEFENVEAEVGKFRQIGGTAILCCGGDLESSKKSLEIAHKYSEVFATVGVHPEHQTELIVDGSEFMEMAKNPKVVAIGECGLDYYSETTDEEKLFQKQLLRFNLELAQKTKLPLVVHCRNAFDDIFYELRTTNYELKVQMHCFTGNMEQMQECIKRGWYISFGGILTFKSSHELREVAKAVPADHLLIETDAPYLAPEPIRGTKNTPANVKIIAEALAQIRRTSVDEIESITTVNAKHLFGI